MNLALGLIYYNSKPELQRLLASIPPATKGGPDHIIAIDGIFQYVAEKYLGTNWLSTDGSTELLKEHKGCKVHIEEMPSSTEFDKRNRYLELCDKYMCDYLVICDSDEYFVYPDDCRCNTGRGRAWKTFRNNFQSFVNFNHKEWNVYNIYMYTDPSLENKMERARCWYMPMQMRYINNSHYHYANIYKDKKEISTIKNYLQHSRAGVIETVKGDGLKMCNDPVTLRDDGLKMCNDPVTLRDEKQLEIRKDYQRYIIAYEHIMQTENYLTHEKAHKMAISLMQTENYLTHEKAHKMAIS